MRGRLWDEKTGSVKGAIGIGLQIHDNNFPFTPCSDCNNEQPGGNGGSGDNELSDGQIETIRGIFAMECSIPYGVLRWQDGKLQYRYCGTWYDVDGTVPVVDAPLGEDYTPELPDGVTEYSACGKATAVMDMVLGVITSILDEVGNFAWQWWGHIKDDNPGVGMDSKWIITAVYGAVNQAAADNAAGEAYDPDALDPSTWQSVKCKLARDFSNAMPEALSGNDVRSKLQTYFASEWGLDLLTNAIFVDALRGINRESFEAAIALGSTYSDGDCDCPVVDPNDTGYSGWFQWGDLTQDLGTNGTLSITYLDNRRIMDVEWTKPDGNSMIAWFRAAISKVGDDIETLTYRIYPVAGYRIGTEGSVTQDAYPPSPGNYPKANGILPNESLAGTAYPSYYEVTVTNAGGPGGLASPVEIGSNQVPWTQNHSGVYRWRYEVVAINGQDMTGG